MKKLLRDCAGHLRNTFDPLRFTGLVLIVALSLWVNYTWDFEDQFIDPLPFHYRLPAMFLFHGVPFLMIAFIWYSAADNRWAKERVFWVKFLAGFLILAFDRSLQIRTVLLEVIPVEDMLFMNSLVRRLISLVTLVLPLVLISFVFERDIPGRSYGLIVRKFNPKPYLLLLGLAAAGIVIGGFFEDIQEYYPRYIERGGPEYAARHDIPGILNVALYELAYGIDFISVEIFFRGFLIYGFVRYFGPNAVYPMIVTYCFLHFGKPMTEAISSLFGGYILGVISLNNKTIWGGVMIHVGIAWLMELIGYLFRL